MILVCGGGPSGVAAAVTAAKNGRDVILVEKNACLGGTLTASLVGIVLDDANKKGGIIREFSDRVNVEVKEHGVPVYEAEKYILEDMCVCAGVKLIYNAFVTDVSVENGKITSVTVISKSGKQVFSPEVVIDATGDGDVAYMAGCSFEVGNENGETQPMSMIAVVSGIDEVQAEKMISAPEKDFWESRNLFNGLLKELGVEPSMGCANITKINESLFYLSVNHEYGYRFDNAEDITNAMIEARKEVYNTVKALRNYGGAFKNITLACTPQMLGVREGRRIKAKDKVCVNDMINGVKREDGVCTATYWVDIHALSKNNKKGFEGDNINVLPYDIPMGALIADECKNLLLSGRNIDGDFYSHASYRVVGNMACTGQAAGAIACVMDKNKITSDEVKFNMIKEMLT